MRLFLHVFAVAMLLFGAPSFAQQAISFDQSNLKPGLKLIFVDDKKKQSQMVMVSRTQFRTSDGSMSVKNADGNTLRSGSSRVFSPHSGYRPPGAGGDLRVGMTWSHTFTVEGVQRTRNCKVTKSGTYKNRYIAVSNAFLVKCVNKRADRPKGMNEQIWFSPLLFAELAYRASWSGGGFSYELAAVR